MKSEQILPTILIAIQIAASIPYLFKKDYFSVLYWVAAAILNISVTFRR